MKPDPAVLSLISTAMAQNDRIAALESAARKVCHLADNGMPRGDIARDGVWVSPREQLNEAIDELWKLVKGTP